MSIENWPVWLKTWRKWLQRTSKSPKLPKILKVTKILKSCRKVAEQLVAKPNYDKSPRIKPDLQGDYCNRRHLDKAD